MSFFNPQVSFCLNFATPFSVMTHNSSENFQLKQYMLWTKRTHKCTIFTLLGVLMMRVHPNLMPFLKPQGQGFSNFATLVSAMKDISSVFKPHVLWTKIAHQSGIFRLLSGWVKIYQIPHVTLEITSQFFFKLCITLQCHSR